MLQARRPLFEAIVSILGSISAEMKNWTYLKMSRNCEKMAFKWLKTLSLHKLGDAWKGRFLRQKLNVRYATSEETTFWSNCLHFGSVSAEMNNWTYLKKSRNCDKMTFKWLKTLSLHKLDDAWKGRFLRQKLNVRYATSEDTTFSTSNNMLTTLEAHI